MSRRGRWTCRRRCRSTPSRRRGRARRCRPTRRPWSRPRRRPSTGAAGRPRPRRTWRRRRPSATGRRCRWRCRRRRASSGRRRCRGRDRRCCSGRAASTRRRCSATPLAALPICFDWRHRRDDRCVRDRAVRVGPLHVHPLLGPDRIGRGLRPVRGCPLRAAVRQTWTRAPEAKRIVRPTAVARTAAKIRTRIGYQHLPIGSRGPLVHPEPRRARVPAVGAAAPPSYLAAGRAASRRPVV